MAQSKISSTDDLSSSFSFRTLMTHGKWEHFCSGLVSGSVAALVLHPFDLVKIRLQVNEGTGFISRPKSTRILGTLREVYSACGFRGLYQGMTPSVIGATCAWGLYFFIYGTLKGYDQGGDKSKKLGTLQYLGNAYLAGFIVLCATNPIWVAKTRMCLQYETLDRITGRKVIPLNMWSTLVSIWRREGTRGLYRGLFPGLVGVSCGAVQFLIYEKLRNFYNGTCHQRRIDTHLDPSEYLIIASTSKAFAVVLTYPYQVVRSRLQEQHRNYLGIRDLLTTLWRFEGVRGFYKGVGVNLLRTVPACGLTFTIYESMNKWMTA